LKFTNGNWMTRAGYDIHFPRTVHDVSQSDDGITLYAPCKDINHRGDTLDGPLLTVKLSSPMANVVRVQTWHYKGRQNKGPHFDIAQTDDQPQIAANDGDISLQSGDLKVTVDKNDFGLNFYNGETKINAGDAKGLAWVEGPNEKTYMRAQLNLDVGENIYGLGERFTPFVKNGQTVDIWNKDGGTSSEQSYKNVPFYLSSKGYGVFVNHPEEVNFEIGSESVSKSQFSVAGEYLDYYMINGPTPKDVIRRYTDLTGKPALPPAWSFGLWLTTSFTTDYNEETVNHFVDGMEERGIPLSVFHFDCFWMKEFEWCNFEWDKDNFPDPQGMLDRLKAKGLNICVWINPYIAQKSKLFDEAAEQGFLIKKPNGDVWQWDLWQAGMGIVDFTNPDACKWYNDKLRALIDMGVDSFKTDFGERIPIDVVYYDGSDPQKMHNYYAYLFNEVVFDLLKEEKGENEAVLFARSSTAGGQKFPVHWGGDCDSTYEAMAESLRGGLSLTLSGFGYWSHDIGGFESTATPDVFKRWTAFGLLSSHSRFHGSSSYRVPWLFDEEAVEVTRHFTNLKNRLMPYLFNAAINNNESGVPVMRAMILEFPEDPTSEVLDRQYMLGDAVLVAPIFNESGEATYYLPKGKWTHLISGDVVEGGTWFKEHYDYMSLPLFVKPNTILPVGATGSRPDYDYMDDVTFQIYELEDGQNASATVNNLDGDIIGTITATRSGQTIDIQTDTKNKPYHIQFMNVASIQSTSSGKWTTAVAGATITPEQTTKQLTVEL